MLERSIRLCRPMDMRRTLGILQHGKADPCVQLEAGRFWWATRTPCGPATLLLQEEADHCLRARAWGEGAEYLLERVEVLIGEECEDFETDHEVIGPLAHRFRSMRVPCSGAVFESLVPAILEQRVTSLEAVRSFRQIVRRFGEPAPGPAGDNGMMLQPEAKTLASLPYWTLHKHGVEKKRADALRRAATVAAKLETNDPAEGRRRMMAVPGIGEWTWAEAAYRAFGDGDAVSVGDYHFKNWVSWALAREPRGTDERMVELLEPFAGHRMRVVRLIGAGGIRPPKWGPRYNPLPIASY